RTGAGGLRLLDLWPSGGACGPPYRVSGVLVDPGPGPAAGGAADQLPEGVFALDRLGLITYANPRAAELLGRPRGELLGRALWEAVPWMAQPTYEDHLRGALLSSDPVHFRARSPLVNGDGTASGRTDDTWLSLSVYPGPGGMTCKVVPLGRAAQTTGNVPFETEPARSAPEEDGSGAPASSGAPPYRPIVLAIALAEAVTARQVSEVVMRELLPAFGSRRLAIYLLQDRRLYLAWETGFPQGFLAPFDGVGLDARLPGVETLTSGRPLFFESMQQMAAAYPGMALDAKAGARAFLPLIASGRPVGSCILGFDRPRDFSTEERTVLTALAGLIAQSLERARRYDNEAALARGLQEALLPHRLSAHPMVQTAGRYLPGTVGMEVGGDWYDVVEAGDGLALVIGDVQGHGVQAAATMGQLRSAVRAFTLGDHTPDEVMSGTNRLLIDLDPGQFASCCYVRVDPLTGVARAARAGHPQPLLRHPDGRTEVLDLPGGVVLGVDPQAAYPVTELRLEPEAVLALYTDGLVERPGTDIDEGVEALRATLAGAGSPQRFRPGGHSLSHAADLLTAEARQARERPDDIALLLTTRRAPRAG
ncbi:SpoIIE family protein phosphatase, partial [Streptomyces sp. NPDC007084]|uniref:SpoIIE family protein phosphatase n=1 Tax=Streptomyces sp. NPDC007084 TaxID=3154313 RepID=UPI0034555FB3